MYKFFYLITDAPGNKTCVFVLGKLLQPSPMFVSKDRTYLIEESVLNTNVGKQLS